MACTPEAYADMSDITYRLLGVGDAEVLERVHDDVFDHNPRNVLFPLKAWLVSGIDLRNHDPQRTCDQRDADQ